MLLWERHQIYLGNLSGCNRARRILTDNGIYSEQKTVSYLNGISHETRARMDSLGQTYDIDSISMLFVRRRDVAVSERLLGIK